MNKLSLFSGIGGDDLASEWAGIETVCFVEKDKYCQKVLKKHWPDIPIIEEVKDVTKERFQTIMADSQGDNQNELQGKAVSKPYQRDARLGIEYGSHGCGHGETDTAMANTNTRFSQQSSGEIQARGYSINGSRSTIDIISGGFPCQPHSVAGKRKGSSDERNLWPEFRRIIGVFKPRWVVAENVPGIFASDGGLFFNGILCDMAKMGYSVGWCTYGAVDVGALHRRNRVFIVGYSKELLKHGSDNQRETCGTQIPQSGNSGCQNDAADSRLFRQEKCEEQTAGLEQRREAMADTDTERLQGYGRLRECGGQWVAWQGSQPLKGIWESEPDVGRVAHGVPHRVDRLKGLGNAVVPQQVYPIYKAIMGWKYFKEK